MTKQTYKEIEWQRREDDILTAAEKLLMERGFANLTMTDLADEIGISKPTLYQHFKGKDELAIQVVMRSYSATLDYLSRPLDCPAIERLIGMIRRSMTIRAPGSILASLRGAMRPDLMMHKHSVVIQQVEGFIQRLYILVDKAKEEGDIDPAIPTPVIAHSLLSLNRSLSDPTLQAEYADNPEKLRSAIDSVIRMFLHGVTPSNK